MLNLKQAAAVIVLAGSLIATWQATMNHFRVVQQQIQTVRQVRKMERDIAETEWRMERSAEKTRREVQKLEAKAEEIKEETQRVQALTQALQDHSDRVEAAAQKSYEADKKAYASLEQGHAFHKTAEEAAKQGMVDEAINNLEKARAQYAKAISEFGMPFNKAYLEALKSKKKELIPEMPELQENLDTLITILESNIKDHDTLRASTMEMLEAVDTALIELRKRKQ